MTYVRISNLLIVLGQALDEEISNSFHVREIIIKTLIYLNYEYKNSQPIYKKLTKIPDIYESREIVIK